MKTDRRDTFFRTGETLGIPWFRLYLADSLSSRLSGEFPLRNRARWLFLHMAVQAGTGHLRTDLENLPSEMSEWYTPGETETDLPRSLSGALPEILEAGIKAGLISRLSGEDSPAELLEVPRPPLVLTRDGRFLYFLRRRRDEDSLLARLSARTGTGKPTVFAGAGDFPPSSRIDTPAGALLEKLREGRALLFLAGGPGTGKTTTVAELLTHLSAAAPDIVLAAPTGRAAARMSESLNISGRTLHGLLGIFPGRPPVHNRNNPLIADLVVVDEASMVDLPVMNYLLDALPEHAVLILAGDPDQLPSVEAGALLGDLLQGEIRAAASGFRSPLADSVVRLTTVYRSGTEILDAASAVRDGDFERLKSVLRNDGRGVALYAPGDPEGMARLVASKYRESVGAAAIASRDPGAAFSGFSTQAVLTPLRRGIWGVPAMNDRISRLLGGTVSPFPGMPVVITGNDSSRGLWNGDRGLILFRGGYPRVYLPEKDGFRDFPVAALPGWEPAWVQTIHKSQGSEFDSVTVLLPEGAERLLTREILYTALTRARNSVDLYARPDTVEAALKRGVIRHSRILKWSAGGA